MAAVYATIWVALVLFAAGELWRTTRRRSSARILSATGLTLAIVHSVLVFEIVHNWSHDDAVLNTAMQTQAVFGRPFGNGVYVNYLFLGAWLADVIAWRRPRTWPRAEWALRAFYFVIVLNAGVLFAHGWRRALGIVIAGALVLAWAPDRHPDR